MSVNIASHIKYNVLKMPKTYTWSEFFKIENREQVTIQVIPDKEINNSENINVLKAFSELYSPIIKRIEMDGVKVRYNSKDHIHYSIVFTKDTINFYLTVPKSKKDYILTKIKSAWNKSAVKVIDKKEVKRIFEIDKENSIACDVRLKNHNIFSLKVDKRDNDPYNAMFPLVKDLKDDDKVIVDMNFTYTSRLNWMDVANDAYEVYKKNKMPRRIRIDKKHILNDIANVVIAIASEVQGAIGSVFASEDKREQRDIAIARTISEIQMNNNGRLTSEATKKKLTAPILSSHIAVVSQSKSPSRAKQNLNSATSSFRTLDADNELEKFELTRSDQIKRMNQVSKLKNRNKLIDSDILSIDECNKLFSLPTSGLQEEYTEIANIKNRETKLSPLVLNPNGIILAEAEYKRDKYKIYLPIYNYDELCLPLVAIGGMGAGKTKGFTANTALEGFRKGFSQIVVDPAKGESCNEIRDSLDEEELTRCIDLDFNNVDYPIAVHWLEAIKYGNRLAGEALATMLMDFISDHTDQAGNRTRRYFKNAAKAIFTNPDNTVLEIALLLESESFRKQMINKLTGIARDAIEVLDEMSPGARTMIVEPVLNRLDDLMSNAAIKCCICQRPKLDTDGNPLLDFRKFMDGINGVPFEKGAFMVLIRASKEALGGKEVRDTLLSYINAKVMLSTLTRNDPSKEYRPCFVFYDEPHQYMNSVKIWEDMVVENRKYRVKYVFLFHSWSQLEKKSKDFVRALKSAQPNYIIYSTSKDELECMKEIIHPFTVEEGLQIKTHHALIKLKAGKEYLDPFICHMIKPPTNRLSHKNNEKHTLECSQKYGTWWEDVEKDIYNREKVLFKSNKKK